jgi:hypothetical protein
MKRRFKEQFTIQLYSIHLYQKIYALLYLFNHDNLNPKSSEFEEELNLEASYETYLEGREYGQCMFIQDSS